jgi:hypothetical protein
MVEEGVGHFLHSTMLRPHRQAVPANRWKRSDINKDDSVVVFRPHLVDSCSVVLVSRVPCIFTPSNGEPLSTSVLLASCLKALSLPSDAALPKKLPEVPFNLGLSEVKPVGHDRNTNPFKPLFYNVLLFFLKIGLT